eukprot:TRINITY_DN71620_c0_g1_i1.p1 TRINITY_DN71620_c0_g1~~TRINITY_DN71620_c0_g1_i1.p1  ORF type:complete len:293 (+),score=71.22 TRINITY_DN71620_c0_g1_i1:155-1033(+)
MRVATQPPPRRRRRGQGLWATLLAGGALVVVLHGRFQQDAARGFAAAVDDAFRESGDPADSKQPSMALRVAERARELGGESAAGVAVMALEGLFLLFCLPGYGAIEYAAGAIFGLLTGSFITFGAKLFASIASFWLILTMRDSKAGQYVERKVIAASNSGGGGIGKRIQAGIQGDAWRFIFVLRLSPLPAWMANYALPLAGVPFFPYMTASLFGMVVPSVINVYTGAVGAKVVAIIKSGDFSNVPIWEILPVLFPLLSSMFLVKLLSSYALSEGESQGGQNAVAAESGSREA